MNTVRKRTYVVETNRFCISNVATFWKESEEAGWQRLEIRKPSVCFEERKQAQRNDFTPTFG
ncbi:hypothetical protein GFC30_2174 [Anoxybacillus amylolyticus]|uniref:Uncharacterized protein n=1 Tax=Anoxybacteroides amylolyticum TaxID=294699 RepID=A0A167SZ72_9BACL|nr:hypothetical protein GFC30_2174 [Anoxybacillus amylolyticus]